MNFAISAESVSSGVICANLRAVSSWSLLISLTRVLDTTLPATYPEAAFYKSLSSITSTLIFMTQR